MADRTLTEISQMMKAIDFAMLSTKSETGAIASRPMSNNRDVEYFGDSYFFTTEDAAMVKEIEADPAVGLSYAGNKGLLGRPPTFLAVEGEAELFRDKAEFAKHWRDDLQRWFKDGIDTAGLVLIRVHAKRIAFWDGESEGEVLLPWTTAKMLELSRTMLGAGTTRSDI